MVHGITSIECKNGHTLPIHYDDNKCGCHHNGKPCITIVCRECIGIYAEGNIKGEDMCKITIPLDEEGVKEINKLLGR